MEEQKNTQPQQGAEDSVVKDGKIFAVLAYLGILCLIPLLVKKDNKFAFFHAKQGLVLFIAEVILTFIWIIPILGWIVGAIGWILVPIIALIGIIQALMGNYWRIPVIADMADKMNI